MKHMKKSEKRKAKIYSLFQLFKTSKNDMETVTTYSAVMRDLRKNHPDKIKNFMKSFKEAFDQANEERLDDIESVALLQALQHIDYKNDTKDV